MAPDFTLPSTQGGKVTLSSFRGKNCRAGVFSRGFPVVERAK